MYRLKSLPVTESVDAPDPAGCDDEGQIRFRRRAAKLRRADTPYIAAARRMMNGPVGMSKPTPIDRP